MHSDCLADITKFSCHFKETQTEHCRQYFNGYHMPIGMEKAIAPHKNLMNVQKFEVKEIFKACIYPLTVSTLTKAFS